MTMVAFYDTKKALKAAIGEHLVYEETSMFGPEFKSTGQFTVVGPSEYNRKWFAQVTMTNNVITKVT